MIKLMPHQIEDARFLADRRIAGNFSGMGSGKTLTALEAVNILRRRIDPSLPLDAVVIVIIIGPPISLSMWHEEFEAHTGQPAQIVRTGKEPLYHVAAHIMSYEIATKRVEELKLLGAKVLICDESHALKSVDAKRTQAIMSEGGLASSVPHAWFLTGTPETRWHDDLYPFLQAADKNTLRHNTGGLSLERFRLRYCITQQKKYHSRQQFPKTVTVGNRNTEELHDWLFDGGLAVRRDLAEVWSAMPPLTVNRLQVKLDMDAELKAMLKAMDSMSIREIEDGLAAKEEHLATIRRRLGQAKVKYSANEIIDRIAAGAGPILVGTWHRDVLDDLCHTLRQNKLKVLTLDGRTPPAAKPHRQEAFNIGACDVLIGQIAACGTSLNLQQGGNHIIVLEEDWSPSIMDQLYARLHRLGQKDHVHVDIFTSDTKLDEALGRISKTKAREHKKLLEQPHG